MRLAQRLRDVPAIDPAANAIEFAREWWSWGDVASLAGDVARTLDDAGLPEGAAIGMLLRNDPAMVGAMIGVLASGRCVVTLNPHLGAHKLRTDIEALRPAALVGTPDDWRRVEVREAAAVHAGAGLAVRRGAAELRSPAAPGAPVHPPLPETAVLMLTSGTTGAPRRVALTTAALERSLLGARHYERSGPRPLALRRGVAVIAAPLVHVGGLWRTLQCVCDARAFALLERFRLDSWLDAVVRHRPRTASLVPAALRAVLEAAPPQEQLASLIAVVSGTAPLPPEDAEAFEARYGIPVLTSYGATEFAGGVAGWTLADHRAFRKHKRGSVGRAHPGCELRVVDANDGQPLAPGCEGLLEVRSAQLGPDAGWLRTTDLARLDRDGFLWITGRADAVIVRGGFKVQPDEVRAALESHPAVREAAVVGLDDARLGQVPVAAVELRAGSPPPDPASLRAHARERLAAYQVPVRVAVVDALPRTPSLKVCLPAVLALFEGPDEGRR